MCECVSVFLIQLMHILFCAILDHDYSYVYPTCSNIVIVILPYFIGGGGFICSKCVI